MEWYNILFIIVCCISAFGWLVYCRRMYKEWRKKKNGEPIFTRLDYEPPILDSNLENPYV
jgi:hypothetical protein